VLDWGIWAMFAANLVIMLVLVPDRRRWLIQNPLDVLIVVLTPPFLPVTMKLARVLPIVRLLWIMVVANRLRNVFSLQGLRYAALIVFTVVVGGGVVFVAVEPDQNLSTWDGLWWAAETVTTVAYGDIYPTTALGRIVAIVVMTAGIGFVAVEPDQNLSTWDGLWWAAETVTTVAYGDIYPTTALGRIVAIVVMTAGIGFVALLTGALAQRFLYGTSGVTAPKADAEEAEMAKKLEDLSLQITQLQKTLEERGH
jgi:voltage-gated potassium channel